MTAEMTLRLAEILAILIAGGAIVARLTRAVARFELIGEQQTKEISRIEMSVQKLVNISVDLTVYRVEAANLASRVTQQEKLLDDLRRGEGYILPLPSGLKRTPTGG